MGGERERERERGDRLLGSFQDNNQATDSTVDWRPHWCRQAPGASFVLQPQTLRVPSYFFDRALSFVFTDFVLLTFNRSILLNNSPTKCPIYGTGSISRETMNVVQAEGAESIILFLSIFYMPLTVERFIFHLGGARGALTNVSGTV